MADIKVVGKRRRELVGPEAKRSRAQSPCVVADFRLPQFNPNSPIGQEFVVPKSGFFCNICSVFCLNEKTAKELHCCSQKHYDNLQKYYEERRQRATRLCLTRLQAPFLTDGPIYWRTSHCYDPTSSETKLIAFWHFC
ncbi:RNA-binding protein 20-like, partial [Oreochromis niloticus]|uniref:RNA-binding protein 20-like n=1 Tax=Oreochromis niloticus TaxID=8128 RepID=UPI00090569EE